MAELVAQTEVVRDAGYMYFVKDGAVWRVSRKQPGEPRGRQEQVTSDQVRQDRRYIYFLGRDGNIWRARRQAPDDQDDTQDNSGDAREVLEQKTRNPSELLYELFPHLNIPPSTVYIAEVVEEAERIVEAARGLADLEQLTPRQLEELLAELLRREGYETWLTPAGRDGGRDVFALQPDPLPVLIVAEAKQMRLVKPCLVRSLEAVRMRDRAHMGLLATTGSFSEATRQEVERHWGRWIALRDGEEFMSWLKRHRRRA